MSGDYFRTAAIIKAIRPFVRPGETVLDIGAGSCNVAKQLMVRHGLSVTAVDVVDHNKTDFPLQLYDGKRLPFDDNSFDAGLLIFVLHHAPDSVQLIREATRVCKKLIIVEDMPGNAAEKFLWEKLDYALNHAVHKDIEIAHQAGTEQQWKDLFAQAGLRLTAAKKFRSVFTTAGMYPHEVFVLQNA